MSSKLKEARESAGYTIDQVADLLKIRRQYVIDLEEENFSGIPGKVYVDGYTKIYHEFLGLDLNEHHDHSVVRPRESRTKGVIKQKLILLISLLTLIVILGIYSFLKKNQIEYGSNDLIGNNIFYESRNNKERSI